MSAVPLVAIGLVFTVLPAVVVYVSLHWNYDGSTTATPFRVFQMGYTVGAVVLVGCAIAIPLAVRGAIGTGPAVFAPFLDVAGPTVLLGLGTIVVALGSYAVAARRY